MREEGIAGWKGHADGTREQPRPCQPQPSVTPPAPPTATVKSAVLVSLGQVHHLSGVFWNRNHCRWKSKGTPCADRASPGSRRHRLPSRATKRQQESGTVEVMANLSCHLSEMGSPWKQISGPACKGLLRSG